MLDVEYIQNKFSFIKSHIGHQEQFHDTYAFAHQTGFCDIWFNAPQMQIKQSQVDIFNSFIKDYKTYLKKIENFTERNLTTFEQYFRDRIKKSTIEFDVIDVPQITNKHDMVLVCSKRYKWLFWT